MFILYVAVSERLHVSSTRCYTSHQTILLAYWGWASECPDVKNYKWRLNPVWRRIDWAVFNVSANTV